MTTLTEGLGKEVAIDMAKRGARVIMACRDKKRSAEAAQEVRRVSGNGNVVVDQLDLASFESVKSFAKLINEREERLDILFNNAGKYSSVFKCYSTHLDSRVKPSYNFKATTGNNYLTEEGLEVQAHVNHFAANLLTRLLLDKIKKSAPSRIVNVNSQVGTCKSSI